MEDLDLSAQTKVSICCDGCGESYYIEARDETGLEGWELCVRCGSNTLGVSKLDLRVFYEQRNGFFTELVCNSCDRKFYFGSHEHTRYLKRELLHCGFCGGETKRGN